MIDDLLKTLEETDKPPPQPVAMPKQWLPSWLRTTLKISLLPLMMLDLMMQKLAKCLIRPPFKQAGHCLKRGKCCHYIMIPESKGLIGKLNYFWQTQVQGFYPRFAELHEYEGKKVHVMGCRYLQKDGRCGQYHLRPMVCRKWPIIEHFGSPRVLKGCGFKPVLNKKKAPHPDNV